MMNEASQIVVLALGVVVFALSLWGLLVPDKLMKLVMGAVDEDWGIHVAVVVRLVFGAALVIAAPGSRFPLIFEVLGWLAIVAAVVIVLVGRERLRRFVALFKGMSPLLIRIWLLFGAAFGAFLVYGVL
jgi:hypothetical protein